MPVFGRAIGPLDIPVNTGIEGFIRALARNGAAAGVAVDAVAPGYADTAMVDAVPEAMVKQVPDMLPISRLAEPEEIGRCVRFLALYDAGFITGATLPVNGGLRMGWSPDFESRCTR
jgi:acetoacetyl-CoA reductase